jgi:chromatin modification-related protein EAF6
VINDADRVFSRSSVSYMRDSDSATSTQSTPNHAGTPTGSFVPGPEKGDKKKKKAAVAEESETDGSRANKRQKITFGPQKRGHDD